MKPKLLFILSSFFWGTNTIFGQVTIQFTNTSIIGEKCRDLELIIPIEIEIKKTGGIPVNETVSLSFDNSRTVGVGASQISTVDFPNLEIRNNTHSFVIDKRKLKETFYIVIKKELAITTDKILYVIVDKGGTVAATTQVTLKRGNDITYTLYDYIHNPDLKLDYITKVESNNNILTLYGYKEKNFSKTNVLLEKEKVLAINEWSFFWNSYHWKPFPLSLTTIPFKVRPQRTVRDTITFNNSATAALTNIGFNIDLAKFQMDRYFANGKKSTHKFSLGFWASPSVEELDSAYTVGYLAKDEKSKQLFISTGITISYSYNDISFVFVPAGWDVGTTTIGKNWVYNNRLWWGFGIAISPKIFATVLNK